MLARKMSGAMKYKNLADMGKELQEISETIDAFDLANKLSSDDTSKHKNIQQEFIEMTVQDETVESILGINYRVNLFENGSIEFNFSKKVSGYENAKSIETQIKAFPFESRTSLNSQGFGQFEVKSNIKLGEKVEFENVMELISALKVE